jgi:hypothetical protein
MEPDGVERHRDGGTDDAAGADGGAGGGVFSLVEDMVLIVVEGGKVCSLVGDMEGSVGVEGCGVLLMWV